MRKVIEYKLVIRYGTIEAFQEYDAEIETIMKAKFGEKGAFDFTPIMSSRSFPPMYFTSFEVPEGVSLGDLQEVDLGYGVLTDLQITED